MAINLLDITANNNDLTNVNTVTEVTTSLPFAQSTIAVDMELDSAQYLSAADSASLSITGDLTFELWFKLESVVAVNGARPLIGKWDTDGAQSSFRFYIYYTSGTPALNLDISSSGSNYSNAQVAWTPTIDVWYHLAVAYDASAGSADFYVDGSQQGTTQTGLFTSVFNGTTALTIGAYDTGGNMSTTDGKIDDVRIWNDVRTVTEISDNMSIELVGDEAGLVAYWPFETEVGVTPTTNHLKYYKRTRFPGDITGV